MGRGSEAGSGEAGAGRFLADKARGVILLRAWVEVSPGRPLSVCTPRPRRRWGPGRAIG